jgi:membrane peptidoglycan carboxypeptidase
MVRIPRPRHAWDWVALILLGLFVGGGAISVWWLSHYAIAVHQLKTRVGDTVFYDADGRSWFRLDEQRHDVPLAQVAIDLQHAVVAIEDRRFYLHPGLDPIGLMRAVVRDVRAGERAEGGSTLSQQLARTLFLSNK